MDILGSFRDWIRNGTPAAKSVGDRGCKVGGLTNATRTLIRNECRDQTMKLLGAELVSAAKTLQKAGEKGQVVRRTLAYRFFASLPPAEQDKISELATALRTGVLDSAAANFLQTRGGQSDAIAEQAATTQEPEPKRQKLKDPAVAAQADTIEEPEPTRQKLKDPARSKRRLAQDLSEKLVCRVDSHAEAMQVMQLMQKYVSKAFPADCTKEKIAPCKTCEQMFPAVGAYRQALANQQKDLTELDRTLVSFLTYCALFSFGCA